MTSKRLFSFSIRTESMWWFVLSLSDALILILSGQISREELTKILTEHGRMPCSVEEAEEYIAMVDEDNDGMLNYKEFVALFTQKIGL